MITNLDHEGYNSKYHTGKKCVEDGCDKLAGTAWGKYWCAKHDIERRERIGKSLENMLKSFGKE